MSRLAYSLLGRPHRSLAAATAVVALTACGGGEPSEQAGAAASAVPADVVIGDVGFSTPESVLHDAAADVYLVSNINGNPLDVDGNGFISRVSPDGTVQTLKWIEGGANGVTLDAPKGMAIQDGVLYVADITCLRMFDASTGAPQGEACPEGATFLNDVAAGGDGTIIFTDSGLKAAPEGFAPSGTEAVYRLTAADGSIAPIAKDTTLGAPNGVAVGSDGITVVTFTSGEAYRLTADGKRHPVMPPSQRQLDGVVLLPDGGLLVSSWAEQCVYRLAPGGVMTKALSGVEAPADIGYDAKRNRVLVPLFNANRVILHTLS